MPCKTKRKTFSPPLPDHQSAGVARRQHLKLSQPKNTPAHSWSLTELPQAEHDSPPVVWLQLDLDGRSGHNRVQTVCGAPLPSPSGTTFEETRTENDDKVKMVHDNGSRSDCEGESSHVSPSWQDSDLFMGDMRLEETMPVTSGWGPIENVQSSLTPPVETTPREQMRQHFVAMFQRKLDTKASEPARQTPTSGTTAPGVTTSRST